MAETTEKTGEKKLSVSPSKTLTLKGRGVEQGVVRQSFSHGRTKAVVVEKVKSRVPTRANADASAPSVAAAKRPAAAKPAAPVTAAATIPAAPAPAAKPAGGMVLRSLTEEEQKARVHALNDARLREAEERKIAEEEAFVRSMREAAERTEREAAEARKADEEKRRKHDLETKLKAEQEAKKRFGEDSIATARPGARPALEPDEDEAPRTRRGPGAARPAAAPKPARGGGQKSRGRLTVVTALSADEERERSVAAFRRRVQRLKGHTADEPKEKLVREVTIPETITIQELANRMAERSVDVIKLLMKQGHMAQINDVIDADTAQLLAEELGHTVKRVAESDVEEGLFDAADDPAALEPRPAVVTVMGHVDHGKTSLLDAIRSTRVAAGEAGGITQHIGAYQVQQDGKMITFLDTPGHEAFTAMRARGAKVTDIAVIVVAADDGVKPQTQEAVDHAKEAGVPMLVAVNKIDKEGAQPDRVRAEMAQLGLQPVEWGGDTEFVNVSAKTREGLDDLLETILVMAEVEELRANPDAAASGTVIESKLDPGRGPVVTILIQRGRLEVGASLVAGAHWGRVRAMNDFMGHRVRQALPGEPVEALGFDGVPEAGEHVRAVENERRARQLATERAVRLKAEALARRSGKKVSLEDIFKSGVQELNLVIKADVAGSLEAIEDEIAKLPQDEVSVQVIRRAVGAVTESDVMLAAASDAVILAFNVRPVGEARAVAEREGVELRYYTVIYRAIEELRSALEGLLAPEEVEETLGTAEVRQIFRASRVGTIAGSHVTEGKITRGSKVRLIRDGTVVYEGEIASLRRFNDDVREVAAGFECGIVLRDFADIKEGDVLEAYATRQVERELS